MPNERQVPVPIEEEMRKSYLDYAMSVIVGRALPDIRDGLKPVHRRVLYAMQELGLVWNRPYKKAARVVGEVLGKYHPHGDSPVYEALVRMVQEFSLRYPLVDGQGNFGSIDGDPPAAMRYTEARLAKIAHEMLQDIDKETVDFVPNFDESLEEPTVLPARVPNLLINGSAGIAVGMATNIPPHNLTEVSRRPGHAGRQPRDTPIEKLMKVVTGPDFPTAGYIYGDGRHPRGVHHRPRHHHPARQGPRREAPRRARSHHHHRAALPGEQGQPHREDRRSCRASGRSTASRRPATRATARASAWSWSLGEGRSPRSSSTSSTSTPRCRRRFGIIMLALVDRRPSGGEPQADARGLRQFRREIVTRRTRYDLARAEERAHILAGLAQGRGPARPGDPHHPPGRECRRGPRHLDGPAGPHRDPGQGHPRHAAPPAGRPRAPEDRGGARASPEAHRGAEEHPGLRHQADGTHPRRTAGHQGGVRRWAAHGDPRRDHRADHRGPAGRRGDGGLDHPLRATSSAPTWRPTEASGAVARA